MHCHARLITALVLLTTLSIASASNAIAQSDDLKTLNGEWTFVEDRTEGRTHEQMTSPMASKFSLGVEEGAVVLNGHGSGHRDVRVALDGSITEVVEPKTISRYRGGWKDDAFEYEVSFERLEGSPHGGIGVIRRTFRLTNDGLIVTVAVDPPKGRDSIGLYRHAEDIPMPEPAKATVGFMKGGTPRRFEYKREGN